MEFITTILIAAYMIFVIYMRIKKISMGDMVLDLNIILITIMATLQALEIIEGDSDKYSLAMLCLISLAWIIIILSKVSKKIKQKCTF